MRRTWVQAMAVICAAVAFGRAIPAEAGHPLDILPADDPAYGHLYRLASAGLAPLWAASVRPLARIDVAHMLADALDRLARDRPRFTGEHLQTLERLVLEFADELALLGYRVVEPPQGPSALAVTGWGTQLVRALTWRLQSGAPPWFESATTSTADLVVDATLGFGPVLAIGWSIAQPLLPEPVSPRVDRLHLSLGSWPGARVIRDALWWGPGSRGAFVLSTDAGAVESLELAMHSDRLRVVKLVAPLSYAEDRYLYGLRADWLATDALRIGVSEATVASGGIYLPYALTPFPFLAYGLARWIRAPEGIADNYNVAIDFDWRVGRGLVVYGELFIDELATADDLLPSRGGATAGLLFGDMFGDPQTNLRLEHARATNWIYATNDGTNTLLRDGAALGHWCAPDCELWSAALTRHTNGDTLLEVAFDLVRKGEGQLGEPGPDPADPAGAWANLYLSGVVETTEVWRLRYVWTPGAGARHELGIGRSSVMNAGHLPGQTREDWYVWWEARYEF